MNKDEWYKNRIEWRAGQHKLFSSACMKFENIDHEISEYFLNEIGVCGIPVLLFWESDCLWTLLTTREVVSKLDSNVNRVILDDIRGVIKVDNAGISDDDLKLSADIMFVGSSQKKIWAPKGKYFLALLSILGMFPLSFRE